jgi:hypothetical protein
MPPGIRVNRGGRKKPGTQTMTEQTPLDDANDAIEALDNFRGIEDGSVEPVWSVRDGRGEIKARFSTTGGWEDIAHAAADEIDDLTFSRYTVTGRAYFRVDTRT